MPVGAVVVVAGHSDAVAAVAVVDADAAVAAVADAVVLQLVAAHCVELEPATEPVVVVVVLVGVPVAVIVRSDEFAAGLVVSGELD